MPLTRAAGFSLWLFDGRRQGGAAAAAPPLDPRRREAVVRKWGVWLAVLGGVVALMYFDYLWELQILYTIRRWVDSVLRFIIP